MPVIAQLRLPTRATIIASKSVELHLFLYGQKYSTKSCLLSILGKLTILHYNTRNITYEYKTHMDIQCNKIISNIVKLFRFFIISDADVTSL